jgi:NAD-dependent SIR2 family protein deacetylase
MHTNGRVYFHVGAGISVDAGIPDFRSKKKIPGVPELGQRKLKEMFELSMIRVSTKVWRWYKGTKVMACRT